MNRQVIEFNLATGKVSFSEILELSHPWSALSGQRGAWGQKDEVRTGRKGPFATSTRWKVKTGDTKAMKQSQGMV